MNLKVLLKQKFSDDEKIVLERYKAAKFLFILSSLVFFLNYIFIGSGFLVEVFRSTFAFSYIMLLLGLIYYIYFFIKKALLNKIPKVLFFIIFILIFTLFLFFSLPLVIKWWIIGLVESI